MLRRRPEKARLQLYRFQQQWNDQDGRIVFYRKPASSSLPLFSTSRSGQISEVIGQRQTKLCHRRLKPIRRRPRTSTRNGSKPEKKEALPLAKRSWSRLQKSTNSYPHQGSSRHSLGTHQECDRSSSRIVAKSFHNENDALSGSCHLDDNLDVKKYEQTMQSNRTRHDFCSMGPLKTVCKHWNQYQQQHRRGYQLLKRQFYRRLHQALRRYHRYRRNISILLAPLCNSEQGKSQHPIQSNHESPESLQSSECWQNKLGMAFTNGQLYSNHHDNVDENGRGIHIHSPLRTRQHPALAAIASNLWIRLALLLVLSMGGFFYCITMMEHQQWQIAGTGSNANWWADLGPSTRTNAATMSMAATAMRSITRSSASTETSGGQSQGTDSATTTNDSERTALESQTSATKRLLQRQSAFYWR
ncbi:hypothetical protein BGW38_003019 [Lunasporangiospora selenospora]|uniref:Uncharacterized protein n=1 Tax=Lunasporangiospora selenospora TaxID=979761 RepID=A0A9P6FR84_9FUNG|nr:hypothetical protein BGW38_003019 [Lunasporangiospora selenospora]